MRHLDLFSGIGGFALAASWVWGAEHQVVAFCEIDRYCQRVFGRHWPGVPIVSDIHNLDGRDYAGIDLLTGGFPCQDISVAGRGAGIEGKRSGLWSKLFRTICDVRPRWIIVENSPTLTSRGLGRVLGDLASVGYDAEWACIPASYLGAPHVRDRMWVGAYSDSVGCMEDSVFTRFDVPEHLRAWAPAPIRGLASPERLADRGVPDNVRVGNGVSHELERIHALGNAVVPQVAAEIFRVIRKIEQEGGHGTDTASRTPRGIWMGFR